MGLTPIPDSWVEQTTLEGIVSLRLPSQWEPEDEEDDGTTGFADEDEVGGVFRVTPLVYAREKEVEPKELPRLIAKRGPMPQRVDDHRYILRRTIEDEEDDEPLVQEYWELVHQTGPLEIVLVVASYTLGDQEERDRILPLLDGLDASLRSCRIETE
jgi:hypothetical protein